MAHHWGYYTSSCPPNEWYTLYPIARTGKRQSPIDIKAEDQHQASGYSKLRFCYQDREITTLNNNGHSVTFHLTGGKSTLVGGPLGSDTYTLLQFHFHWGSDNSKGSEHFLNGKQYSAEMHLVHMNTKYTSTTEAVQHADGLAVIGVFIEVGEHNEEFQAIVDNLRFVHEENASANVTGRINITRIFPKEKHYNFYSGSLTTPGLQECVTWINMLKPIHISNDQISEFRKLLYSPGDPMVNNFRPCQPLHDRKLTVVDQDTDSESSDSDDDGHHGHHGHQGHHHHH